MTGDTAGERGHGEARAVRLGLTRQRAVPTVVEHVRRHVMLDAGMWDPQGIQAPLDLSRIARARTLG